MPETSVDNPPAKAEHRVFGGDFTSFAAIAIVSTETIVTEVEYALGKVGVLRLD